MKACFLVLCTALALFSAPVFAQESAPFIYYYSPEVHAMIVERADGSDRRSFDIGDHSPPQGPGFSPDGAWFASAIYHNSQARSSVVSVDGTTVVTALNPLSNVPYMDWSPDSRYILVSGTLGHCEVYCYYRTYWLIDVQSNLLVSAAHFFPANAGPSERSVEWSEDGEAVTFYVREENFGPATTNTYRVVMETDGDVMKQNVSYAEFDTANPIIIETPIPLHPEFISPDGRYSISPYTGVTDTVTGQVIDLPSPIWYSDSNYAGQIIEARWDESGEWVFLGYSVNSGDVRGVSIARADGTDYRQLSFCGFGPSCVGWLPDNVDIDSIPLLADAP